MWLFLIFVLVPIVEIALFIQVGGWLGLWPTLAIVVLTALAGTVLLRSQGTGTLAELQRRLREGEDPTRTLAHGALIIAAGVVLLTPGFFTDAVGLSLMVPAVRDVLIRYASSRIVTAVHVRQASMGSRGPGEAPRGPAEGGPGATIVTDYEEVAETPETGRETSEPTPGNRSGRPSGWQRP